MSSSELSIPSSSSARMSSRLKVSSSGSTSASATSARVSSCSGSTSASATSGTVSFCSGSTSISAASGFGSSASGSTSASVTSVPAVFGAKRASIAACISSSADSDSFRVSPRLSAASCIVPATDISSSIACEISTSPESPAPSSSSVSWESNASSDSRSSGMLSCKEASSSLLSGAISLLSGSATPPAASRSFKKSPTRSSSDASDSSVTCAFSTVSA